MKEIQPTSRAIPGVPGRLLSIIGLLAVAFALGACGSDDSATGSDENTTASEGSGDASQTISVVEQGAASNLPIYVADRQGFIEDEGLELEVLNISSGAAELVAGLNSGDSDVIIQTPLTLQNAVQEGAGIKFFMGIGNADTDIVVAADNEDVPAAADANWEEALSAMEGYTVGTSVRGSTTGAVAEALFREAGLEPGEDVTFVVSGPGPQSFAALRSGEVDAIVVDTLASVTSRTEDVGRVVLSLANDEVPAGYADWMQVGAISTDANLEQDSEKYAAFARAVNDGVEFMQDPANQETLAQIVADQYDLSPEAAQLVAEERAGVYEATIPPEKLEGSLEFFQQIGMTDTPPMPYDDLVFQLPGLDELYR